jgi:hypothetical protein
VVQLQLLSGSRAGSIYRSSHFPIRGGRAADSDLNLVEPGIWDRHFLIDWCAEGLVLESETDAMLSVNDSPVCRAVLRNGDIITLGALKIRFSLSPVRQSSLAIREWLTWLGLGALCAAQVALVYVLIR